MGKRRKTRKTRTRGTAVTIAVTMKTNMSHHVLL
jgi:hypothetical protein